jgi:TonB family protein
MPNPGAIRQAKPAARSPHSAAPEPVQNLEAYLQGLADEILLLAGGDGVAIALAENRQLLCRAASGIAPPLGARIDARSGLTGACLSTGTLLRCDDSEQDGRVDRQVCRALGIRSMICVPLTAGEEIVGIFEIFSSRPNAFFRLDLGALHARAEEIARAFAGEEAPLGAAVVSAAEQGAPSWTPAPHPAPSLPLSPKAWQAVLGVLVLALGLFLFLRAIRGSAPAASANVGPQVAAVAAPAAPPALPQPRHRPEFRRRARLRASPDTAPTRPVTPAQPASLPPARAAQPADTPAPPSQVLIATETPGGDALPQLVSSLPAAQPSLAQVTPVSSGVPAPVLVRQVQPQYPGLARQNGIEGAVVLEGLVDEKGRVRRLRVDSGNSLLISAALRAVQQWRYRPPQFNGRPVEVPIRIVLKFELGR